MASTSGGASPFAIDLSPFVNGVLLKKATVATDVWRALIEQKESMRGKYVAPETIVELNGKIRAAYKRCWVLNQQVMIVYLKTNKNYEAPMPVDETIDQDFQVWMASREICADEPDIDELYRYYLINEQMIYLGREDTGGI